MSFRTRRLLGFVLIGLAGCLRCFAADLPPGRPALRVFDDRNGLPQNSIECMTFDRTGYLWVGTQDGAAVYNGQVWKTVNMPNRRFSNWIRAMLTASDGSLWFGTFGGGLARLKNGAWTVHDKQSGALPGNRVRSLAETAAPDGSRLLWVGTEDGLARFDGTTWTAFTARNSGLPSDIVLSLLESAGGSGLWAGTQRGLARLTDNRWTVFDSRNSGLPSDAVLGVLETDSALWVGTEGGLARFSENAWTAFKADNSGLPNNTVQSLLETTASDGRTRLWIGTMGGAACLSDGKWTTLGTRTATLPNDNVKCLAETKTPEGRRLVWIGTWGGGLVRLAENLWQSCDATNGLPNRTVWWLSEQVSPEGGAMWIATDGGLAKFENGAWTSFTTGNSKLPSDSVECVLATTNPSGRPLVWVGTGHGLSRFESNAWTTFDTNNSPLPNNLVVCLFETKSPDGRRFLWAGTLGGGLARVDQDGAWTIFDTRNSGLPNNNVLIVFETVAADGRSVLWIGTDGGLVRFSGGEWATFDIGNSALPNNNVRGLCETRSSEGKRTLWVGTRGGAAWFDWTQPQPEWTVLTDASRPTLPNNTVYQVCADASGRVYFLTVKGITRLTPRTPTKDDPSSFELYTFTVEDGLPSNECNRASLVDSEGRIWAGTVGGAAVLDPRAEIFDRMPKPLRVERVRVGADEFESPGKPSLVGASLGYANNNYRFEFALLGWFREGDTRYKVRLVGVDPEPTDWTATPNKEYTNLGDGRYVFQVWGRDHAGNVSGPVEIAFRINPPPWKTWWAFVGYIVAGGAGVYGLTAYQVNRVQRKAREALEKQEQKAKLQEAELRAAAAEIQAQAVEAESRRKSEELAFARRMQLSMLPKENLRLDRIEIIGRMRTATEVGGDYYDFIKIDDRRYCLAVGDATGHGVGAGLVVGMVKALLVNSAHVLAGERTVMQVMADLNSALKVSLLQRNVGMALGIGLLDADGLTVDLCSTGMPFPCVFRRATSEIESVRMPGPPLGFLKVVKLHSRTLVLEPGDCLLMLSDGFHERMNEAGEIWGYDTVLTELTRVCREETDAERIADRLVEACDRFAGERETDDDMTMVIVRVRGVEFTL